MEVVIETRQNLALSCKLLNVTEFNKKIEVSHRNVSVRMRISHEIFYANFGVVKHQPLMVWLNLMEVSSVSPRVPPGNLGRG